MALLGIPVVAVEAADEDGAVLIRAPHGEQYPIAFALDNIICRAGANVEAARNELHPRVAESVERQRMYRAAVSVHFVCGWYGDLDDVAANF